VAAEALGQAAVVRLAGPGDEQQGEHFFLSKRHCQEGDGLLNLVNKNVDGDP